jgi:hypothetical protein
MNEEKKETLRQRRDKFEEIITHEDQQKEKQGFLDVLEKNHESYGIIWAESPVIDQVLQWVEDNFPFTQDGRVDWEKAQDCSTLDWKDESEVCEKFSQVVSDKQLGNPNVLVIWDDVRSLCLRVHLLALAKYANSTFCDHDTWIVCQDDGWVIETSREGKVSFCRQNQ